MRALAATLILGALVLAGCAADAPAPPADQPPAAPPAEDQGPFFSDEDPTFCDGEQGCDFWDDEYHEYVLYEVDTYVIDVLIIPPASPFAVRDMATFRAVVANWTAGIKELALPWFAENLTVNAYVIGEDVPTQEALSDPEIIIVGAEYNPVLLFGIGYQAPDTPCRGPAEETYPPHSHDGMTIHAARCQTGGLTCIAANTNFLLGGERRMYDLVSHEYGHCLGIGHVGDALDFRAKRVPVSDIMSYQYDPEQVHCVSSLNVRVLEGVYAHLVDQNVTQPLPAGDFYTMDPRLYHQVECAYP